MQITSAQRDVRSLEALGAEARRCLCAGDIESLHRHFGYALAFDRDPVIAIGEDLAVVLAEIGAARLECANQEVPRVSYIKVNDIGLIGIIESVIPTNNGKSVLLELIITTVGTETHVTFEQLSGAA